MHLQVVTIGDKETIFSIFCNWNACLVAIYISSLTVIGTVTFSSSSLKKQFIQHHLRIIKSIPVDKSHIRLHSLQQLHFNP